MQFSAAELNAMARALVLEKERRRHRHLVDFLRGAWATVEGYNARYVHNWHIEAICEHLEALQRGDIHNLLLNVPPGTSKSIICSVVAPVWLWTVDSTYRVFSASYAGDLSTRDAVRSRYLILSPWFQERWGSMVKLDKDVNQKTRYQTVEGGWRLATSVGGRGTGEHPDYKIVDDPHNVKEAESDVEREAALTWFDLTLSSRGASRNSRTLVIMQRLHEKDLSGHIMSQDEFKDEWVHICLPMRAEPKRMRPTPLGFNDPRDPKSNDLLWPDLFDEVKVKKLERKLGSYGTAGQLQQRPAPEGGGILKTKFFRLWGRERPIPAMLFVAQSYDTAYTEKTENDPTACLAAGIFEVQGRRYGMLLDAWSDRMEYPELRKRLLRDWKATYGGDKLDQLNPPRRSDIIILEEKGSGLSLRQDLHRANIPVFAYNPGRADKIARAHQAAPVLELDCWYVPESRKEPGESAMWARPFLKQLEDFPNGEHDDFVDTFTQLCIYLRDADWLQLDYVPDDPVEEKDYDKKTTRKNPYGG